MAPDRWTARGNGASLANPRCVRVFAPGSARLTYLRFRSRLERLGRHPLRTCQNHRMSTSRLTHWRTPGPADTRVSGTRQRLVVLA